MSSTFFEEFLSFISPIIGKQSTVMRGPFSPSERLAVTLRYLVTGDAQCTVAASYRISSSAVSRIITETCDAIWTSLKRMHYLDCPSNFREWKSAAQEFKSKWNFPQLVPLTVSIWSCRLPMIVDVHTLITRKPIVFASRQFTAKKTITLYT